ncbi:uncharacterized protein LOC34620352 [Cyclospora cayetanensis]|uniref:Uncharacterized protein LOC34620352 n=1 Tax=Cyclospora cayetanensis TaxID=88456 RepID=A0A6P5WD25_9EIME|nr:uncharacterized protein LOC34620352 [Cyclospora cayetanensis]
MGFGWRQRAYCAPMPSCFSVEGPLDSSGASLGASAASGSSSLLPASVRGSSETFSVSTSLSQGLLGCMNSSTLPNSDIFFLPKPSNFLRWGLPVLVFLPNLTLFTRSWPFYASKAS